MMRLITFFFFLLPILAGAEEMKFSPKGSVKGSLQASPFGPKLNRALYFTDVQAGFRASYTKEYSFQFDANGHLDRHNNSKSEKYWLSVPEAYFQWKPDSLFRLQTGWNVFHWGVTDGFNPLDVVNARRYSNPLSAEKLGAFSVSLSSSFGDSSIEGIYIPIQRKSILPGDNSRWLPREFLQNQSIGSSYFLIPSDLNYYYREDQVLNAALQNNFGFKFSTHFPSLDISLVGFDGAGTTPATNLSLTGTVVQLLPYIVIQADPKIGLRPVYYRQSMVGGSFTYALDDILLRFEAAFTKPHLVRSDLPAASQEYVGGLEKTFEWESHRLMMIFEGTYAHHGDATSNLFTSLSKMFDRSVMLAARYSYGEGFGLLGNVLVDTKYHSQLFRLEATKSLTDSLKLIGSGEIFMGPLGSPIGTYQKNDRATLSLKYFL